MLHRDENGNLVSADKLSDITAALADIEKVISSAAQKGGDNLTEEEKAETVAMAGDLKVLMDLITPDMKKATSPMQFIGLIKQLMKIKNLAEKLNADKKDGDN